MEGRLKVTPDCQYPGFKALLWAAAAHLARRLQQQQQRGGSSGGGHGSSGGSSRELYGCELSGVPVLLEALQQWVGAAAAGGGGGADVPQEVQDPAGALAVAGCLLCLFLLAFVASGAFVVPAFCLVQGAGRGVVHVLRRCRGVEVLLHLWRG